VRVTVTVNGTIASHDDETRTLLVHYLREGREERELTGTNIGESVKSCTVLAAQGDGEEITTIEGMAASDGALDAADSGRG